MDGLCDDFCFSWGAYASERITSSLHRSTVLRYVKERESRILGMAGRVNKGIRLLRAAIFHLP